MALVNMIGKDVASSTPALISGAIQFDMQSKSTGRTYRIYLHAPTIPPPSSGYPAVYFTDGNFTFPIAAMLSELIEFPRCAPPLIVGIGYAITDLQDPGILRLRDMTCSGPGQSVIEEFLEHLRDNAIVYGGAEEFYRFLIEELTPEVAARYPIDRSDLALFGHSLGGLFALDTLFKHPEQFRTFVAASPAIWWNDRAILHEAVAFRSRIETAHAGPKVLITVGSMEQSAEGLPTPTKMTRERFQQLLHLQRWVDNARELASELAEIRGPPNFRVEFHNFEGETHGSVVAATISKGLRFAVAR